MFEQITVVSPTSAGQKRDYELAVAKEIALMYTPTDFDPPRHSHFTMKELLGIVPKYLVNTPSVMQLYKMMTERASHKDIMRDISVARDDNLFYTGFWLFAAKFNKKLDGMEKQAERLKGRERCHNSYPIIKPMFSGTGLMFEKLVERVESDRREARQIKELYKESHLRGGRGILGDRLEDEPFLRDF